MAPTLGDFDSFLYEAVDNPVFIINPPAPPAGPVAFQRFGIANALMAVPNDILQYLIDSLQRFFILGLPVQIIVPTPLLEGYLSIHSP